MAARLVQVLARILLAGDDARRCDPLAGLDGDPRFFVMRCEPKRRRAFARPSLWCWPHGNPVIVRTTSSRNTYFGVICCRATSGAPPQALVAFDAWVDETRFDNCSNSRCCATP